MDLGNKEERKGKSGGRKEVW